MADTAVTVTDMTIDAFTTQTNATEIVHANTHTIDVSGDTRKLLLHFRNTTAATKVFTVVAPTDNPAAVRAPLGNVTVSLAAGDSNETAAFAVVESARFAHTDGKVRVTVASDTTGWIRAYRLPKEG